MSSSTPQVILGIESSCDETAAAVLVDGVLRSNVIAGQPVHEAYGGVVPELASRAHQEHIVPVVHEALRQAGLAPRDLSAVAFTQGPGLIGALLVGTCFARSLAQALGIPLLAVDHLRAHALAHFIRDGRDQRMPAFPFLNLTVSGGHTLLVQVHDALRMEVIGSTLDDAAGEAFDKGAKLLGLSYPGGPLIERLAWTGDDRKYPLPLPEVPGLNMSFSGLKTAFRDHVRAVAEEGPDALQRALPDLCASLQRGIVDVLIGKLRKAGRKQGIHHIALSGGVSANGLLRERTLGLGREESWEIFIPPPEYCTDNAAMVAMAGSFLLQAGESASLDVVPHARPVRA